LLEPFFLYIKEVAWREAGMVGAGVYGRRRPRETVKKKKLEVNEKMYQPFSEEE